MIVREFGAGQEVSTAEMTRSGLLLIADGAQVSASALFVPVDAEGIARRIEVGPGCRVAACAVVHGGTVLQEGASIEEAVQVGRPECGYAVGHVYPGAGAETVIGAGVVIRAGAVVYAGVELAADTVVGHHTLLRSFVTVGANTQLGHHLTVERMSAYGVPARLRSGPRPKAADS
jgi:acetyltransferase-like isoleucine patch superfamily enzyme